MSYIVAFVRFAPEETLYPVNCWRSDVKEGDAVVVRMKTRGDILKRAEIAYLAYLNWNCANTIECLASEAEFTLHGIFPPNPPRLHQGVNRPVDVWNVIREFGWRLHRTSSRTYKFACSARNTSSICYLFFRKNGVDIQIMNLATASGRDDDILSFSPTVGDVDRADCRGTDANFYVYLCDLAKAFSENRDCREVNRPSRSKRQIPWSGPAEPDRDTNWRDASGTRVAICTTVNTSDRRLRASVSSGASPRPPAVRQTPPAALTISEWLGAKKYLSVVSVGLPYAAHCFC